MIDEIGAMTGLTSRGQPLADELELLGDDLAVPVDVGAPVELDPDDRQADARGRADALHAGGPVQARLDRAG